MKTATTATTATASENALEAETWCNDCGMLLFEDQECPAYVTLYRKRKVLLKILQVMEVNLKVRDGVNILVVDEDGHEVHL